MEAAIYTGDTRPSPAAGGHALTGAGERAGGDGFGAIVLNSKLEGSSMVGGLGEISATIRHEESEVDADFSVGGCWRVKGGSEGRARPISRLSGGWSSRCEGGMEWGSARRLLSTTSTFVCT